MQTGHIILGQCIYCEHFNGYVDKADDFTCSAFPKGIPELIVNGEFDHRVQYGDEDILFKVAEGREDGFSQWAAVHQVIMDLPPVQVSLERTRRRPPLRRDD